MSLPLRIGAAATLLTLILVGVVIREGIARDRGREVNLAINTYDPRSPLSGHYVAFQLRDFGETGHGCPPGASDYSGPAHPKWTALSQRAGRYHVTGAAATRAEAQALGEVVVRGAAFCFDRTGATPAVTLDVGVNRFHADQRQAEALAKGLQASAGREPTAFAVVSIDDDGKARLKGVIINGERTDLTWW